MLLYPTFPKKTSDIESAHDKTRYLRELLQNRHKLILNHSGYVENCSRPYNIAKYCLGNKNKLVELECLACISAGDKDRSQHSFLIRYFQGTPNMVNSRLICNYVVKILVKTWLTDSFLVSYI